MFQIAKGQNRHIGESCWFFPGVGNAVVQGGRQPGSPPRILQPGNRTPQWLQNRCSTRGDSWTHPVHKSLFSFFEDLQTPIGLFLLSGMPMRMEWRKPLMFWWVKNLVQDQVNSILNERQYAEVQFLNLLFAIINQASTWIRILARIPSVFTNFHILKAFPSFFTFSAQRMQKWNLRLTLTPTEKNRGSKSSLYPDNWFPHMQNSIQLAVIKQDSRMSTLLLHGI